MEAARPAWVWPVAATAMMGAVLMGLRWWFGRGKEPVYRYDPPPTSPPDGGIALEPQRESAPHFEPPPAPPAPEPERERELQPVG